MGLPGHGLTVLRLPQNRYAEPNSRTPRPAYPTPVPTPVNPPQIRGGPEKLNPFLTGEKPAGARLLHAALPVGCGELGHLAPVVRAAITALSSARAPTPFLRPPKTRRKRPNRAPLPYLKPQLTRTISEKRPSPALSLSKGPDTPPPKRPNRQIRRPLIVRQAPGSGVLGSRRPAAAPTPLPARTPCAAPAPPPAPAPPRSGT